MSKLSLKYGKSIVDISNNQACKSLELKPPENNINKEVFLKQLRKSISLTKNSKVGIIVSDKTRLCGYELYIPWLTEMLESEGIPSANIIFYIAYGTHPPQSKKESLAAYGDSFLKYKFIHHNCDDSEIMTELGTSSRGTLVQVRSDILEYDLLILFGAISHHYFAGYGGGRKLIFPGLASRQAIYHNHKLYIDFDAGDLHPGCQSGELNTSPVALDLEEIDSMLPEKLIISGILNDKGLVSVLKLNKSYKEFKDSCKIYKESYHVPKDEKYDLVIASAGGYPKDINYIQTHKALHNAASFVKDNGKLILLAECIDGIGNNEFIDIFSGAKEKIINGLANNYSGNGGTALATLKKTSRIKVHMLTELNNSYCERMGVTKINLEQINHFIKDEKGSCALIKNASIIF